MTDQVPRYQTKSAYAAAMLRQAFAEGKYVAGERLQIAKLAKDYGLSLTPVREALFELANEGLVDMQPHRGARVADVPITDLNEVYLVREVLESAATRLAAQRVTPEQIRRLEEAHARFVAAAKTGQRDRLRALSDEFHDLIYDAARSPLLQRLIRAAWLAAPADTFTIIEARPTRSVDDHDVILRALSDGDPDAAEQAMRQHVKGSLELIRAAKTGGTKGKRAPRRSATDDATAKRKQPADPAPRRKRSGD